MSTAASVAHQHATRPRALPLRALGYAWAAPWTLFGLLAGSLALACGARAAIVDGVVEIAGGAWGASAARGRLPFGVCAITFGHVVLGTSAQTLATLRAHEHSHVRQYERWGPLFVPAYLASSAWQALRGGCPYRDNAFEREARALGGG